MLQRFALLLLVGFLPIATMAQEAWPDKTRALPQKLRKVPVALTVMHDPNPNYPEVNDTGDQPDSKYVWKHKTIICSPNQELTVIEAGSFIWYDESGWKANVYYNKGDFKKRFACPKGILKAGECYTFEKNYRWGSNLYGGDALWYILARDSDGKVFKGIGLLETEAELLEAK